MNEARTFFHFPTNEYDLKSNETAQTKLLISGAMKSAEKIYDRTFRIDCIILEPIDEETYVDPFNPNGEE